MKRLFFPVIALALSTGVEAADPEPVQVGDRLELFVEDTLIDSLEGDASLRLHHPVPREIAIEHDAPWEGTGCGYHSIFRDGDLYRMYYKSWHLDLADGKLNTGRHPLYCCYAESRDGKAWTKPNLGIHDYKGSTENNIAITSGDYGDLKVDAGHPAVFRDDNPDAPPEGRYKAILRSSGARGLIVFQSPDGRNWKPLSREPIFNGLGAFDSQNLAFWDPVIGKYRAYWRIFTAGTVTDKDWKPEGFRAIRTATSDDLVNWSPHRDLVYDDSPDEHLYTNQVKPYHRAPHILIGFPTRYIDRGPSEPMKDLPDPEDRETRAAINPRYGYAITEGLLMASRDGVRFKRWNEAFLRPGTERPGTWHYGAQYLAWHVVETASDLPGAPPELSLYSTEGYWHGEGSALRRYTLRLDGFVSVNAGWDGGELLTKPLVLEGSSLALNYATSAAGSVRVEVRTAEGDPVPGFALEDCPHHFGDTAEGTVHWENGSDISAISGRPVRLRFVLKDADLYSFRAMR